MRIALYIEDGCEQIILTPQSNTERHLLAKLHEGHEISIKQGQFYACQGGWVREGAGSDSSMLVLTPRAQS